MIKYQQTIALVIALWMASLSAVHAHVLTQTFDDFETTTPGPNADPGTQTVDDWTINDMHILTSGILDTPRAGDQLAYFPDTSASGVSGTNSYVETPWMSNGVGNITFYLKNYTTAGGTGPFRVQVQWTTNDVDWVAVQTITNLTSSTWSEHSVDLNAYDEGRVRIFRGDATMSSFSWLGIDDITVSDPPATVLILDHGIEPAMPRKGDTILFWADIVPSLSAINIEPTLEWEASGTSGTLPLSINPETGRYEVTLPENLPALETITYEVIVSFDGFNADSPQTATGSFFLLGALPASAFDTVRVAGELDVPMELVMNQDWIGLEPVGPLADVDVFFETENEEITRWSDPDQTTTTLPIFGDLTNDPLANDIRIDAASAGWLLFQFNEALNRYNIQQAEYQPFDDWDAAENFGNHTIDGWTLTRGRATDDPAFAHDGFSIQFEATSEERAIMSPILTDGIGTVMFRYRNTSTTLQNPATFQVQARAGASGDWVTLATEEEIFTPEYFFTRVPIDRPELTQMRIVVPAGAPETQLLLDDVIITQPGPTITFEDLEYSPVNPTILDTVDVSVTLTPTLGASITNATLWFRVGTDGVYDPAPMTNTTGNTYVGTIPRGAAGTMQFYVESTYFNPASGNFQSARDPLDRTGNPESYNVEDMLAGEQNFDAFGTTAPPSAPGNMTENGWTINDIHITTALVGGTSGNAPAFFPDTLFSGVTGMNSYIETPVFTNGIGVLSFDLRSYTDAGGTGPFELQIFTSTDDINWEPLTTITNRHVDPNSPDWVSYTLRFDEYEPLRIRFLRDNATSEDLSWLGIDNIQITYPPVFVAADEYDMHPAYPSAFAPISVYATIESVTTFHKALNIEGIIEYQTNNQGPWEEARMQRYDNGLFIGQIPGYPNLTEIEYRIRADFKGYNDGRPGSDRSPTTFTSEDFQYRVRRFPSAYERINVTIDGDPEVDLMLQNEGEWEGIVSFVTPISNPIFTFDGFGFYDGETVTEGLTSSWGDSNQTATNAPLFGNATPGDFAITLPGENLEGQYIFRFNENSGQYTVVRAVYQDFENWPADNVLFGESYAAIMMDQFSQNFADWTESDRKIRADSFDSGWDDELVQDYPEDWNIDSASFVEGVNVDYVITEGGILVDQADSRGALLIPGGRVRNVDSPRAKTDIGTFEVELRAARPNDFRPATYTGLTEESVRVTVDLQALEIPLNSARTEAGHAFKSIIVNYIDPDNYYEARVVQYDSNRWRMELWTHKDGTSTRRRHSAAFSGNITDSQTDTFSFVLYRVNPGEARMRMYQGTSARAQAWTDSSALPPSSTFGVNTLDATVALNRVRVYENLNEDTSYDPQAPLIYDQNFSNNADGWIGRDAWEREGNTYRRPGYVGDPIEARVEFATDLGFSPLTTVATYSDITHSDYRRYSVDVRRPEDGFIRIRYFSNNPAGDYLVVGNVYKDGWRAKDVSQNGWNAQNVWVDSIGRTGRGIEMRNSRVIGGSDGSTQYIASPPLPGGASVMTFDYRRAQDASGPVSFEVQYQIEGFPTWETLTSVDNHSGSGWANPSFSYLVEDRAFAENIRRLRIRNTTNGHDDGLIIDNIVVTSPPPIDDTTWWGYNVLITDTRPSGIVDSANSPWLYPQLNNEFGAFLNNSYTDRTGGSTNDEFYPFIQSARMPDGIGEIRFQYRAWDETDATIQIVSSTDRLTPQNQWTLLDTVNVNSTEWQEYRNFVFDRDNEYVAIRLNPTSGNQGRVSIDNLLLTAPMAAGLRLQSIQTIPEIPRYFDDVDVQVEVSDLFLTPTNIQLSLLYAFGTNDWGQYNNPGTRDMEMISSDNGTFTYRTMDPIPAPNVEDEIVQYQVVATFDGFFAEESSPQMYRTFQTPDHYWPLNFNQDEPNPTPYYIAFATLPGQIWINEFNVAMDAFGSSPLLQYIEVAGIAHADISNWEVSVINTDFSTNITYQIPNPTTLGNTDGYGFFVLGNENTAERHMDLTATLPSRGGLQLARPIGIIEQRIAYDTSNQGAGFNMSLADSSFQYAGYDTAFLSDSPFFLIGTGSNRTDFAWQTDESDYSHIGSVNKNQVLIPWPTGTNGPPVNGGYTGTVEITAFWQGGDRLYATINTDSESLVPTPWYTTNLMENPINWQHAPNPQYTSDSTNYTVSFDPVEAPMVYYTISVIEE